MPRGVYELAGGITERFSCAPGPSGWRYVGERSDGGRLDLTIDGSRRVVRLVVEAAGWTVRGGVVGPECVWLRTGAGADPEERAEAAAGFAGASPAYLVATARLLGLPVGGRARLRLVLLTEPVLGARTVDQDWVLAGVEEHRTETGALAVERFEVTDLATGERRETHLAGDVVVWADGVELTELAAPPNRF